MEDLERARDVLAESCMRVCKKSGLVICHKSDTCGVGFSLSREAMRHHLKKFHQADNETFNKLHKAAATLCAVSTQVDLQLKYCNGGARQGFLPRLEGIPLLNCKQCVKCDRLFVKDESLRAHASRDHSGCKMSVAAIRDLSTVPCQSLGKTAPRLRPFLIAREIGFRDGEESVYDPGAVSISADDKVEDRYKSPFISMGKVTQRLRDCSLTLEKVHLLLAQSSPWNDALLKKVMEDVKITIREQFNEARRLARQCGEFHNFLIVIQTSGVDEKDRSFSFLDDEEEGEEDFKSGKIPHDTKQRYVEHLSLVVRVAVLVATRGRGLQGVFMSEALRRNAMEIVMGEREEDPEGYERNVFDLLWNVFKEKQSEDGESQANEIFAYVICACLCVHHDKRGKATHSNGKTVGSRLAGILYGASCIFTLYVLKYRAEETYNTARNRVMTITDPLSLCGVGYMTDLRSICSSLRTEEAKLNLYQACEEHVMCGIFDGKEFSARQYGDSVRRMHGKIREGMFADLLNGAELPSDFWSRAWNIVEDADKDIVGYWAMSDERNINFVRTIAAWAGKAANSPALRANGWLRWKEKAEEILLLILTAMHITGGGPSRGTELGTLTIRNTVFGRRSVYFCKDEVMLFPFYNKTRKLKRGKMILLTRHIDQVTAGLFRAYFLLVHPVLVTECEWHGKGEAKRHAVANVRDSLTLGRWKPRKLAEEIGRTMAVFDIPFTFSEFRQHQRGLAQSKRSISMLRILADATEASTRSVEARGANEDFTEYQASIEQGGHSTRTAEMFYSHSGRAGQVSVHGEKNKIELFRRASQEWHEDLGLRNDASPRGKGESRMICSEMALRDETSCKEGIVGKNVQSTLSRRAMGKNVPETSVLLKMLEQKTSSEIMRFLHGDGGRSEETGTGTRSNLSRVSREGLSTGQKEPEKDAEVASVKVAERASSMDGEKRSRLTGSKETENTGTQEVGSGEAAPVESESCEKPAASPETVRSGNLLKRQGNPGQALVFQGLPVRRTEVDGVSLSQSGGKKPTREYWRRFLKCGEEQDGGRPSKAVLNPASGALTDPESNRVDSCRSSGVTSGKEGARCAPRKDVHMQAREEQGAPARTRNEPRMVKAKKRRSVQNVFGDTISVCCKRKPSLEERIEQACGSESFEELLGDFEKEPAQKQGTVEQKVKEFESKIVGGRFDAEEALRKVTTQGAIFKSPEQRAAMEAVASRRGDLLVILATGEGKTAVVMGPVSQETGVTVWVSPLRALKWETDRRLRKCGIEVFSLHTFEASRAKSGTGIVLLVSPEDVVKPTFRSAMEIMHTTKSITRVVIDESHLAAMAESYRSCFTLLKSAARQGTMCPLVMLTATAPPAMVKGIAAMCGSHEKGLEVHRGDPCRANLALSVEYLVSAEECVLSNAAEGWMRCTKKTFQSSGARCLVVCLTIDDAIALHGKLVNGLTLERGEALLHHSRCSEDERERVMRKWQAPMGTGVRVVVATEGFSTGTDAPNVRLVLFAGASRNIIDFWQGAGRAGRDGREGKVVVLFHEGHLKKGTTSWEKEKDGLPEVQAGDFGSWARNKRECRRAGIERCLSGDCDAPTCFVRWKRGMFVALCDICAEKRRLNPNRWPAAPLSESVSKSMSLAAKGVKRPSGPELNEARNIQVKRARFVEEQRMWLRHVGQALSGLCLQHVLHLYQGERRVVLGREGAMRAFQASRKCRGSCEKHVARCHRCQQVGHRANDCAVFASIRYDRLTGVRTGDGKCRECRLVAVYGSDPHSGTEFGQSYCPLKKCIFLMLRAWDRDNIRKDMLDDGKGISWGNTDKPKDRKQFALWLTEESVVKEAGICKALKWLCRHLPADIGTL